MQNKIEKILQHSYKSSERANQIVELIYSKLIEMENELDDKVNLVQLFDNLDTNSDVKNQIPINHEFQQDYTNLVQYNVERDAELVKKGVIK